MSIIILRFPLTKKILYDKIEQDGKKGSANCSVSGDRSRNRNVVLV
jgi:hypothetical protein